MQKEMPGPQVDAKHECADSAATPRVEAFHHADWTFSCQKAPMLNNQQMDQLSEPLKRRCDRLPDAVFGLNFLRLVKGDREVVVDINARDLLEECCLGEPGATAQQCLGFSPAVPLVRNAAAWQKKAEEIPEGVWRQPVERLTPVSDWTFASRSAGRVEGPSLSVERRESGIPREPLTDSEAPMLWFQQIDLFDDDLSDSGLSRADVKIRVMPTFWFVLLRLAIRVDDVIIRQIDTRLFHAFGTSSILREFQWREASYETLIARGENLGPGSPSLNHEVVGTQMLSEDDSVWLVHEELCFK